MPTLDLGQVVGPQGAQGPQGVQGQQGNTGPQGVPGANGITPNIQVGTVTTLAPGSDATVTRQADSPDAAPVFDFGLPRGADSVNDGDMKAAMYDPQEKGEDIFSYADAKAAAALAAAKDYAYSKEQSLSEETAELSGLGPSAVPDDIFRLLLLYANSGSKFADITVLDGDGNPFPGVSLSTVKTIDGKSAVTDENGKVFVVVENAVNVTFSVPYSDVKAVTQSIGPSSTTIVNSYTVTMPFVEAGYVEQITSSKTYQSVYKQHNVIVCCAGGGYNGSGGNDGHASNNLISSGGSGGYGGSGGKIYNQNFVLQPNETYDAVVASTAGTTTFGSITSANGTTDTLALNDSVYSGRIGGNGGNGGDGGGVRNDGVTGTAGYVGSRGTNGGGGGGGGGGGSSYNTEGSGASGGNSPYGGNGSSGNSGQKNVAGGAGGRGGNGTYAGGGGGGGGGGSAYDSGKRGGAGGAGGAGGPGIILIKFLD